MNNNSKTILLFYFLVIYVILQFAWWWYLLLQLNIEIADIKKITLGTAEEIYSNNLNKKIWMFFGEGAVFLLLLTAGVWQVRKAFYKEASLSEQQKNFLLSITHELKTPVASAKLQLQTLLLRTLEKEKQNQFLKNTLNDLERLDNLRDMLPCLSYGLIEIQVDMETMDKFLTSGYFSWSFHQRFTDSWWCKSN